MRSKINSLRYKPNSVRGVSVHFGEDVLEEVLEKLDLRMIVRGHQVRSGTRDQRLKFIAADDDERLQFLPLAKAGHCFHSC